MSVYEKFPPYRYGMADIEKVPGLPAPVRTVYPPRGGIFRNGLIQNLLKLVYIFCPGVWFLTGRELSPGNKTNAYSSQSY